MVIAIIKAILGGDAVARAGGKAKQKAQGIACISNLRQWGLALNLYLDDNRDVFPLPKIATATPGSPGYSENTPGWSNFADFHNAGQGDGGVVQCAAIVCPRWKALWEIAANAAGPGFVIGKKNFDCPGVTQPAEFTDPNRVVFNYGMNSWAGKHGLGCGRRLWRRFQVDDGAESFRVCVHGRRPRAFDGSSLLRRSDQGSRRAAVLGESIFRPA